MAFPPALLERIRSQVALSSLIGRYVSLKRHGKEYTGLCPFHGEKTPSFTVNDVKGFFHCFGCSAHGDAIGFIERYERLSWREAVKKLARELGIAMPEQSPAEDARYAAESRLLEAMEAASAWFQQQLALAGHYTAREYLEARKLSTETCRRFRIGYAPEGREALKRYLLGLGFPEAVLVEAGLLIKPDDGGSYDRFRSRIIFPIRNARGRVIAFGGRLMAAAGSYAPKYLNSPETPLFKKGEVLFNLDQAGAALREKENAIIVEGYMDAIAMVQAGFASTVATLGTAVTETHLKTLWRFAKEPVLCLDGDEAGKRASIRAAELALPLITAEQGLRFAFVPSGEDPDSLLRKGGAAALEECIAQAADLPEVLWRHFAQKAVQPREKAELKKIFALMTQRVADRGMREEFKLYFDEKLGHAWAAKKGQSAAPPALTLHAPPARAAQLHAMQQALALFAMRPELLHEPEAEAFLHMEPCGHPALDALHQALLEMMHAPEANGAALRAALDQSHGEAIALLRCTNPPPPLAELRLQWRQLALTLRKAGLEAELIQLQQQDASDGMLARLSAVHQELQATRTQLQRVEEELHALEPTELAETAS